MGQVYFPERPLAGISLAGFILGKSPAATSVSQIEVRVVVALYSRLLIRHSGLRVHALRMFVIPARADKLIV